MIEGVSKVEKADDVAVDGKPTTALKLTQAADNMLGYLYTLAFSFVVFWFLLRVFNTILDHLHARHPEIRLSLTDFETAAAVPATQPGRYSKTCRYSKISVPMAQQ